MPLKARSDRVILGFEHGFEEGFERTTVEGLSGELKAKNSLSGLKAKKLLGALKAKQP